MSIGNGRQAKESALRQQAEQIVGGCCDADGGVHTLALCEQVYQALRVLADERDALKVQNNALAYDLAETRDELAVARRGVGR